MNAFRIESPRLWVREWRSDDRSSMELMVGDPTMMRYLTDGRTWRHDEVDEFLDRQARHLRDHDVCIGPLLDKGTGHVVGIAGIQPLETPGHYELGWWVWRELWGRGYATEVGRALVAYAFDTMTLPTVYAVIDPDNIASIRVAEKLGMQRERILPANETNARRPADPVLLYRLDRPS